MEKMLLVCVAFAILFTGQCADDIVIKVDRSFQTVEGKPVTIVCDISSTTGYPQVAFARKRVTESTDITNSTDPGRITVVETKSENYKIRLVMYITSVNMSDHSLYDCEASLFSSNKKSQFEIEVIPSDSVPVLFISGNMSAKIDEEVIIQCNASSHFGAVPASFSPALAVTWFQSRNASHIGEKVTDGPKRTVSTLSSKLGSNDNYTLDARSTLKITALTFALGGHYTCQLDLKLTQYSIYTYKDTTMLAVEGSGGAKTVYKTQKAKAGKNTELTCSLKSDPPSKATWKKDGMDLSYAPGSRFRVSSTQDQEDNVLTISDVQYSDRANFTCNATNGFVTVMTDIRLRVRDPLGAVWPFIGIIIETIILVIVITVCEKYRKSRKKTKSQDNSDGSSTIERKETSPLLPKSGEPGVAYSSNVSGQPEVNLAAAAADPMA